MVTIQDVARAARVSAMTVSNVLNNRSVRQDTRARVVEAIERLGYRVNMAARNLRAGRTMTIGLAVPGMDQPYFAQLAARLVDLAGAVGYRVAVEQTRADPDSELQALHSSRYRLYDGQILSAVGLREGDPALRLVDAPTVLLGESVFNSPFDHIALPTESGTHAATLHLHERGCRRLAFIGGDETDESGIAARYRGFRSALSATGLEPVAAVRVVRMTASDGLDAMRRLLATGEVVDGVVCVNDAVALGVIRGLVDAGLRVPQDVKVIGFDGIDDGRLSVPSLSTVATDHDAVAALALERLLCQINEDPEWQPQEFVCGFRIEERESTALHRRAVARPRRPETVR